MIAEVIYSHPLPTAAIVACTFGMLIGLGLFAGTTVLIKQDKIKPAQIAVFYLLSLVITLAAIFSLIKALK